MRKIVLSILTLAVLAGAGFAQSDNPKLGKIKKIDLFNQKVHAENERNELMDKLCGMEKDLCSKTDEIKGLKKNNEGQLGRLLQCETDKQRAEDENVKLTEFIKNMTHHIENLTADNKKLAEVRAEGKKLRAEAKGKADRTKLYGYPYINSPEVAAELKKARAVQERDGKTYTDIYSQLNECYVKYGEFIIEAVRIEQVRQLSNDFLVYVDVKKLQDGDRHTRTYLIHNP